MKALVLMKLAIFVAELKFYLHEKYIRIGLLADGFGKLC